MKYFKIYGERRCGTKFLREHIKLNTSLTWIPDHWNDPLGWKHGQLDMPSIQNSKYINDTLFCLIVKHPLSWLSSMYRNAPHMQHMRILPFEEFIFTEWDEKNITDKMHRPAPEKYKHKYKNILDLRKKKLESHLQIRELPNYKIFRFEDVFLGEEFKKSPNNDKANFSNLKDKVEEYYMNEEWRDDFTDDLINKITLELDENLEREIGYHDVF
jgi:hypothetical protein